MQEPDPKRPSRPKHYSLVDQKSVDPWEDAETAHLREFLELTYTERFNLLMHAIEFMNMLRPPETEPSSLSDTVA